MTATAVPAAAPAAGRRPGSVTVLPWEAAKLAAQARSRALIIGAIVVPIAVVLIFNTQLPPKGTIYGRHIHTSGYAVALIGQATLTDSHGNDVPNPVFEWDGAFDPDN